MTNQSIPRQQTISATPTSPGIYRADIDGLRAIAVVAVLLYHCGVTVISGGFIGVDVFFVISGYLISGHLATEAQSGRISLTRFFERRARRIAPALIVTLILTWFASSFLLLPSYLLNTSQAMVAASLSVSNFFLWRTSNYFAPSSGFQPFLHTWSLSVEDQFYLTVPVLMASLRRWFVGRWIILFFPLTLASFFLSVLVTQSAPTANFYLLPTRAWELGVGAIAATVFVPPIRNYLASEVIAAVGLLMILSPIFIFDDNTPFPGLNALYPCVGAAMLILVGRDARPMVTRLLSWRPVVAIGLISYSLYLVHWPIISLLHFWTMSPFTWPYTVVVLVSSFVLAAIMWRGVEQPFRTRAFKVSPRVVAAATLAGVISSVSIGTAGIYGAGFPGRFPNFTELPLMQPLSAEESACFELEDHDYPQWVQNWSLKKCTLIGTGPQKVLLWGDSFAAQYAAGLVADAAGINATVVQYNAAGCPPIMSYRSYRRPNCADFNRHALDIIKTERFDTVLISARWTNVLDRGLGELESTLKELDTLGVDVLVIGQSPQFVTDVQAIKFLHGINRPKSTNKWEVDFLPSINKTLLSISSPHRFIDPMPALCEQIVCTYEKDGDYLFLDDGHLSRQGSFLVVEFIQRHAGFTVGGPRSASP